LREPTAKLTAVARKGERSRENAPAKQVARRRGRRARLLPLVIVGVMAFLYYRPLASYVETRGQLSARSAEVVSLRAEKIRLERRLELSTSVVALGREARRIGYVRPGERLFIVKGISAWRRAHKAIADK
jgi:cell division protein FtsB